MTPEQIFSRLQEMIVEQFTVAPETITYETTFEEDLGADSVDLVDLVMGLEEEFEIGEVQEDELTELKTVGDVVNFLASKLG